MLSEAFSAFSNTNAIGKRCCRPKFQYLIYVLFGTVFVLFKSVIFCTAGLYIDNISKLFYETYSTENCRYERHKNSLLTFSEQNIYITEMQLRYVNLKTIVFANVKFLKFTLVKFKFKVLNVKVW